MQQSVAILIFWQKQKNECYQVFPSMLRIMVNLPDEYLPLVEARMRLLKRSSLSHYGRCLIDDDLGGAPINHHAHAAAVERAADENAQRRKPARRTQPKP